MTSITELTRSSSFIFSGTVVDRGNSTVLAVPPAENLVIVRLDRALRANPALGNLTGKMITVAVKAPETLELGQQAVFFTHSWVHGGGVAVREVEHVATGVEDSVVAAVAELPALHLSHRLQTADLVVYAEVASVRAVENGNLDRKTALWAAAELRIDQVLQGAARKSVIVHFPTAGWPPWNNAPRFHEGQRGVFILHVPSQETLSEKLLQAGSLVALDPADFQAESQVAHVETLLARNKQPRRAE